MPIKRQFKLQPGIDETVCRIDGLAVFRKASTWSFQRCTGGDRRLKRVQRRFFS
jgi:hypothetical protein